MRLSSEPIKCAAGAVHEIINKTVKKLSTKVSKGERHLWKKGGPKRSPLSHTATSTPADDHWWYMQMNVLMPKHVEKHL